MCLQKTHYVNVYSSFLHNCPKLETNSNGHQGEQTHKLYIPTVEYHSARKRNKPLVHATTRVKLRGIMLSQTSQILKRTYSMDLCTIRSSKTGETRLWCSKSECWLPLGKRLLPGKGHGEVFWGDVIFFFYIFIIIALQRCVSFCSTTK